LANFGAYNNQLTGAIPVLTSLINLTFFDASSNQLTGSIPSLPEKMAVFSVSNNRLTGAIPSLDDALKEFFVGHNQLTGVPPAPSYYLQIGELCPNNLTFLLDAGWDAVTGYSPWWGDPYPNNECDDAFTNGFE
jgi:hypothetical protein